MHLMVTITVQLSVLLDRLIKQLLMLVFAYEAMQLATATHTPSTNDPGSVIQVEIFSILVSLSLVCTALLGTMHWTVFTISYNCTCTYIP